MRVARKKEINYEKYLENWPYEYYQIMDARKRRKVLELSIEQGLDPEGDALRMEIWNRRYPNADLNAKKGTTVTDDFLAAWMHLDFVNEKLGSWFMGKKLLKDTKKYLEKLGLAEYEARGEIAKEAIHNELYHLTCFYIKLCTEDDNYGSLIMGVGKLTDDAFANKVADNIYRVCYRATKGVGLENEFRILQEAAHEAYEDLYPEFVYLLDEKIQGGK